MHAPTLKSFVTTYPVPVMGMHPFLTKTRLVPHVRGLTAVTRAAAVRGYAQLAFQVVPKQDTPSMRFARQRTRRDARTLRNHRETQRGADYGA